MTNNKKVSLQPALRATCEEKLMNQSPFSSKVKLKIMIGAIKKFGKFEIVKEIGSDAMSKVYFSVSSVAAALQNFLSKASLRFLLSEQVLLLISYCFRPLLQQAGQPILSYSTGIFYPPYLSIHSLLLRLQKRVCRLHAPYLFYPEPA